MMIAAVLISAGIGLFFGFMVAIVLANDKKRRSK